MSSHSYFAQIDANNIVLAVHVVTPEFMAENPKRYPGTWVRTYFDLPNKTYAGVGYIYLPDDDDFMAPPNPEINPDNAA
jgi:hypothetical protein